MKKKDSENILETSREEFNRILIKVIDLEGLKRYGVPFSRKTLYNWSSTKAYPFIQRIGGILCVDIGKFYAWIDATNDKKIEIKNKFNAIMGEK